MNAEIIFWLKGMVPVMAVLFPSALIFYWLLYYTPEKIAKGTWFLLMGYALKNALSTSSVFDTSIAPPNTGNIAWDFVLGIATLPIALIPPSLGAGVIPLFLYYFGIKNIYEGIKELIGVKKNG